VLDCTGLDHREVIGAELMKRDQPVSAIETVLGANCQRVIGDIWSIN
jgi:hypothetical protein